MLKFSKVFIIDSSEVIIIKERNFGIDLLKTVCMIQIVFLHVLGQGGILLSPGTQGGKYFAAWFIETLCFCAVDCYALISGYVNCENKFKLSNIVYLWLQVAFYSVGITLVLKYFFNFNLGTSDIVKSFLPVTNSYYWYFSAYFCVFFFTPALNFIIKNLDKKTIQKTVFAIFMLFCVIQVTFRTNVFATNSGYCALWLCLLYIIGGYIKKYGLFSRASSFLLFFLYLISASVVFLSKTVLKRDYLLSYISPFILLCAVFLVLIFSKITFCKTAGKIIKFITPLSFGVYLIHTHPLIFSGVLYNRFAQFAEENTLHMLLYTCLAAFSIFLLCIAVDFLRLLIFKLLKIKQLSAFVSGKISHASYIISDFIFEKL